MPDSVQQNTRVGKKPRAFPERRGSQRSITRTGIVCQRCCQASACDPQRGEAAAVGAAWRAGGSARPRTERTPGGGWTRRRRPMGPSGGSHVTEGEGHGEEHHRSLSRTRRHEPKQKQKQEQRRTNLSQKGRSAKCSELKSVCESGNLHNSSDSIHGDAQRVGTM